MPGATLWPLGLSGQNSQPGPLGALSGQKDSLMSLIIFDKDNTLIYSYPGRPANCPKEQILLPGVAEKCARLREQGHYLAIASNQGGVASGKISQEAVLEMLAQISNIIQAHSWRYCPHSSRRDECSCRKPKPGMILSLMAEFGVSPGEVIFVGDMESDQKAAEAAGVRFEWAGEFFGWPANFDTILKGENRCHLAEHFGV